jgi:hypothetical protein
MSNALAIAAVTATLRNLLVAGLTTDSDLADATVTMQPLDRARANGNTANQLNVFLYHVTPSGTWRNVDLPGRTRSGESAFPPLGLNLYYLLTAFGRDNDTQRPFSHQLMGRAMSILNDHPILGAGEIKAALPNNDLWTQVERVRFTLQPYSVEEIAKLWTGFQTQYRLSVAYEAAVVLIDSNLAAKTPVPVLMRGPDDAGITAHGNLLPPFPLLTGLTLPRGQTTATLGDTLILTGANLSGANLQVQFTHLLGRVPPFQVPPDAGSTDQQVTVKVPNKPVDVPAGLYGVSLVMSRKGESPRFTNDLPLAVAPSITTQLPIKAKRVKGNVTLKLTCAPEVRPGQRVALLVGDLEIPAGTIDAPTGDLVFSVVAAVPGTYFLRLRVDGVDSQLIDRTGAIPAFDKTQQVTIT